MKDEVPKFMELHEFLGNKKGCVVTEQISVVAHPLYGAD